MIQAMGRRELVLAACVLWLHLLGSQALAGSIVPSEIDGEYGQSSLGNNQPPGYPVTFTLSDGFVTGPSAMSGFGAANLTVTFDASGNPTSITPNFVMTGTIVSPPTTETITYSFTGTPHLAAANEITSTISLVSNLTSPLVIPPPINLVHLNPARLLFIFPSNTNFDPSWPSVVGPVIFELLPVPEPASIILLAWGGALGLIGHRRRNRGLACAQPA